MSDYLPLDEIIRMLEYAIGSGKLDKKTEHLFLSILHHLYGKEGS